MVKKYKSLQIEEDVRELLDSCESTYRKHHPELDGIVLTKSKILREVCKFYIRTD